MREFMGTGVNLSLTEGEDDGKMIGLAEVILIYSEPAYIVDLGGGVIRRREVDSFRIAAKAVVLRKVAKDLAGYADDLEALEKRVTIEPVEPGTVSGER